MTASRRTALGVVVALGVLSASCSARSSDATDRSTDVLTRPTSAPTTTSVPAPETQCTDATASYPALDPLPEAAAVDDDVMRAILTRGRLRIAVDENTAGLASRDPESAVLVGLEIDLARQLARAIFHDADDARVQFTTVTTKEKIEYPQDRKVDLAISAISMTCDRWDKVALSSEYFTARHQFLVREDSGIHTATDVGGQRVCMTKGSTSIKVLEGINETLPTKAVPLLVDARTDCLVALQEGEADAYLGHDTFLVGMVDQDPDLRIVDQGEPQHYAIAINRKAIAFTQYVNGVLQQLRDNDWLRGEYQLRLGDLYRNAYPGLPDLPSVPDATTTRRLP